MPRKLRCSRSVIAHYRGLLNLTQLQLAVKADVSERVVRRAEAGESLRMSTLDALARALSPEGMLLKGVDLTCDPLAVAQALKRAYTDWGVEIVHRCQHLLSPDVVVAIYTDVVAFGGEFHGLAGLEKVIRDGTAQFEDRMVQSERWSVEGNRVMVLCHELFRLAGSESGPRLETWLLHEYTVVDGRVSRIDSYIDSLAWVRYLERTGTTREAVVGSDRSERTEEAVSLA
jgi:ketosteroid isomerase-like protein